MRPFFALLFKEFISLIRDYQSLLALFFLPAAFILIMTFALQDQLDQEGNQSSIPVLIVDSDQTATSELIIENLRKTNAFEITRIHQMKEELVEQSIRTETHLFAVFIPENFQKGIQQQFNRKEAQLPSVKILSSPRMSTSHVSLIQSVIEKTISKILFGKFVEKMNQIVNLRTLKIQERMEQPTTQTRVLSSNNAHKRPSSVQQSVPAWLVFGLFFIIFPVGTTFINERNQGTLDRLRAMGLSGSFMVLSRIIPYYIINMIQVYGMILVGTVLVPALGGTGLEITGDSSIIFIFASFVSFAAISFSFFVASISRTAEQATIVGGVSNILLAAIGGIMVPSFVMPEWLQVLSRLSPMNWGLSGFLSIFLHGEGFYSIRLEMIQLGVFTVIMVLLSILLINRKESRFI